MDRFGGKQSGGSGSGKDDPGKSGSGPGKTSLVDQLGGGTTPTMTPTSPVHSAPLPTGAAAVSTMAALNIQGEVQSFGNTGGVAGAVVAALPHMQAEQDVAEHTIAMFQYMDAHAGTLAAKIATDFDALVEPDKKNTYLLELQHALNPKLGGKGLWTGEEQRGNFAFGLEDVGTFFRAGKVALMAKATAAQTQNRPLVGLLANHSMNMEAKSYGRRAESMQHINVASLPMPPAPRPQVGVQIACNDGRCKYLMDDYVTPIAGTALQAGKTYVLYFNGSENLSVTVQSNDGTHLVFSEVE